jgi:hypothetical protein
MVGLALNMKNKGSEMVARDSASCSLRFHSLPALVTNHRAALDTQQERGEPLHNVAVQVDPFASKL